MRVILIFAVLVLLGLSISAQRPEDMTRKLWDTAFSSSSTKKSTNRRRAYRNATPNVPVNNVHYLKEMALRHLDEKSQ